MPFELKQDEDEARERLRAFWRGASIGRPALHVLARNPTYQPAPAPRGMVEGKETDLAPEWHAWMADEYLRQWLFLGEAMPGPVLWWGSGLTMIAVLAGAGYEYRTESAWVRPMPDVYDRPLPTFDPRDPVVSALERCYGCMAEVVGERGYLNPPPLMDGFTTLSLLRTPSTLCIDLIERPDDVRRWCKALTALYISCYNHFYSLLDDLGYDDTAAWLKAMAEGPMDAIQCDMAVLLSRDVFEECVMPDSRSVSANLAYSLYHLDGTEQMRFIDQIASLPGLRGIQWNPEVNAGPPSEWIGAFTTIRERGLSLHIECPSVDEAIVVTRVLGPDGLLLVLPPFESVVEAASAISAISAVC